MREKQVNKVSPAQRDLLIRIAKSKNKYIETGLIERRGYNSYYLDGKRIHSGTVNSCIHDGFLKRNEAGSYTADSETIKENILSCSDKIALRTFRSSLESMREKGLWIKLEGDTFTIFKVSRGAAIAVTDIKADRVLDCNLGTNIVPEAEIES